MSIILCLLNTNYSALCTIACKSSLTRYIINCSLKTYRIFCCCVVRTNQWVVGCFFFIVLCCVVVENQRRIFNSFDLFAVLLKNNVKTIHTTAIDGGNSKIWDCAVVPALIPVDDGRYCFSRDAERQRGACGNQKWPSMIDLRVNRGLHL